VKLVQSISVLVLIPFSTAQVNATTLKRSIRSSRPHVLEILKHTSMAGTKEEIQLSVWQPEGVQ